MLPENEARTSGSAGWQDSPVAWSAVLERAVREQDAEMAELAESELQRLGVTIGWARGRHVVLEVSHGRR